MSDQSASVRWRGQMRLLIFCFLWPWHLEEPRADAHPPATSEGSLQDASQLGKEVEKLYSAGRVTEALPLAERQLRIRQALLDHRHPDVASSLSNLGLVYIELGRYEKAEVLLKQALQIFSENKRPSDVAENTNNLAYLYQMQGAYDKAEPLYQEAVRIQESVQGGDRLELAHTLNNLASLYQAIGAYDKAEPLYLRTLSLKELVLGKNHSDVAISLSNIAILYSDQGAYDKAEPLFLRALNIQESLGKDNLDVAVCLHGLADLYRHQGAFDRAVPLLLRALRIKESVLGKNHPASVVSLMNLAALYQDQGAYEKAEPLYLRGIRILEEVQGKDHPEVAYGLILLASLYHEQQANERAESLFPRIFQILDSKQLKSHPKVASALNNLAALYAEQGAFARAESLYQRAIQIHEAIGDRSLKFATTLINLAIDYQAQDATDKALAYAERAILSYGQNLRVLTLSSTESRLDAFLGRLPQYADVAYSLLGRNLQHRHALSLALGTALLYKGRSLDETAMVALELREMQTNLISPAERDDFSQLQVTRRRLAALYLAGQGQVIPGKQADRMKGLEAQIEGLEQKLALRSRTLRYKRRIADFAQIVSRVSQALPADGALVEVVQYRPFNFRATSKPSRFGPLHYLAMVLLPGGECEARDLGPAAPIDQSVALLLRQIADRDTGQQAYLKAAQSLYHSVFAPLLPALRQRRHVFLALDGQMQMVPFAALHDGQGFLLDRYSFTYLGSGRDLLRPMMPGLSTFSVVVMANPDFAHAAPASGGARTRGERAASMSELMKPLPELPGTQDEAEMLKRRFPQALVLTRAGATESALLGQRAPSILHLATHGLFVEDAVIFTGSGGDSRGWGAITVNRNPAGEKGAAGLSLPALSRSALMLAGAKAKGEGHLPGDDGLATALEMAGMDLGGTQLVVLSACDTGRGEVRRGQGIYGFRRAFFIAGTETLVTSLWTISDQSTAQLMDRYYEGLQQGGGRLEAMEQAMKEVRSTHAHPFYWAPFIVLGQDGPLRGSIRRKGGQVLPPAGQPASVPL